MSAQSVDLICESCGYKSSDREIWGLFYYRYDNWEISIKRVLGWCKQCNEFCPIEDFSNQKDICEEIESLINDFKNDYSQKKLLFISKKLRKRRLYTLSHITELNEQLKIINIRAGSEKCLVCGSSNIGPLINRDDLFKIDEINENHLSNKRTGIFHPECGGEIIASPSPVYIQMESIPKYYNPDGTRHSSSTL